MTTVRAVYEGGVLRPAQPLPFGEGEIVEITVAKPKQLSPDEWERQIRAAKTIHEWVALANACPAKEPDFDVVQAINETRHLTGFRLPESPLSEDEVTRRLQTARTLEEWIAATKLLPPDDGGYDIEMALRENRR